MFSFSKSAFYQITSLSGAGIAAVLFLDTLHRICYHKIKKTASAGKEKKLYLNNRWRWKREVAQAIDEESRISQRFGLRRRCSCFLPACRFSISFFKVKTRLSYICSFFSMRSSPQSVFYCREFSASFTAHVLNFPFFSELYFQFLLSSHSELTSTFWLNG